MARLINIGGLALHNFRVGEDNLVVKYDDSKSDKEGKNTTEKHLFTNSMEPLVCLFLALGVFFALDSLHFSSTEKIFQGDDNRENAASQRYCTQLAELFSSNSLILRVYIREDHANSHGI